MSLHKKNRMCELKRFRLARIGCSAFLCLASQASPHLSLGPQDVGHEGVATRCRELNLPSEKLQSKLSNRSFQRRSRAFMACSAFLCLAPKPSSHLRFRKSFENEFSIPFFHRRSRARLGFFAFLCIHKVLALVE